MHAYIARADGSVVVLTKTPSHKEIRGLIGADTLETVSLRNGTTLYVDDAGHQKNLPRNEIATTLYHAICRAGTTHHIVGDAVVAPDAHSF